MGKKVQKVRWEEKEEIEMKRENERKNK